MPARLQVQAELGYLLLLGYPCLSQGLLAADQLIAVQRSLGQDLGQLKPFPLGCLQLALQFDS